jgi:hypothetical protein
MNQTLQTKLRLIYFPFLQLSVALIASYTFLNWLLMMKLHLLILKEDVTNLWVPFALPWLCLFIWHRKRIKLLRFKHFEREVTGKNNEHLTFRLYIVCPIYDKGQIPYRDTNSAISPPAWIGKKYTTQISNRLSSEEKQDRTAAFMNDCKSDYLLEPATGYVYFDEIPYSDDLIGYRKAAENSDRYHSNSDLRLLIPHLDPFEKRNGNNLIWIPGSFAIGACAYLLLLLLIPLNQAKVKT